jgi:hypothetical protein
MKSTTNADANLRRFITFSAQAFQLVEVYIDHLRVIQPGFYDESDGVSRVIDQNVERDACDSRLTRNGCTGRRPGQVWDGVESPIAVRDSTLNPVAGSGIARFTGKNDSAATL